MEWQDIRPGRVILRDVDATIVQVTLILTEGDLRVPEEWAGAFKNPQLEKFPLPGLVVRRDYIRDSEGPGMSLATYAAVDVHPDHIEKAVDEMRRRADQANSKYRNEVIPVHDEVLLREKQEREAKASRQQALDERARQLSE